VVSFRFCTSLFEEVESSLPSFYVTASSFEGLSEVGQVPLPLKAYVRLPPPVTSLASEAFFFVPVDFPQTHFSPDFFPIWKELAIDYVQERRLFPLRFQPHPLFRQELISPWLVA